MCGGRHIMILLTSRLKWGLQQAALGAFVIAMSLAAPGVVVFGTGAIAFEPHYLLAVGGIVTGGVMTISTLFGRTLATEPASHRD